MILVKNKDTKLAAYIPEELIQGVEKHSGHTRVYIVDHKQKHDYFLDVKESPEEIKQLIRKAHKKPKREPDEEMTPTCP